MNEIYFSDADEQKLDSLMQEVQAEKLDASLIEHQDIDFIYLARKRLVKALDKRSPKKFLEAIDRNKKLIYSAAEVVPEICELLILGYKRGIAKGSGECTDDLGAIYYMGTLVEQDYQKAAAYYHYAFDHDCMQTAINLGYIYEYGRLGTPDFDKAYKYYSLAAIFTQNYESFYKLGDLFMKGKGIEQNKKHATQLYFKSFWASSYSKQQKCHAALRLAKLYLSPEAEEYGLKYDPSEALQYFQIAELGFYEEIKDGYTYYARQLDEAIAGQQEAREAIRIQDFKASLSTLM